MGKLPTDEFLKEEKLFDEYGLISKAVKNGDIKALEDRLDSNMEVYI